jgi:uncharacterized protein
LVDANVWLAIAVDGHAHHVPAVRWFDGQAEGTCAFCRITQLALLRHLTNPKIMGEANVQTQAEAWLAYEALATDPRVLFVDEPTVIGAVFKSLTQLSRPAHKRWTDAYLAAFATAIHAEVVTFDADFNRIPGVAVKLLVPQ